MSDFRPFVNHDSTWLGIQGSGLWVIPSDTGRGMEVIYNQATTKLAFHSNETSNDKLSIV